MEQQIKQVEQLLWGLMQPSTEIIRNAASSLNKVVKKPSCVEILFSIIANGATNIEVRRLAAIIVRKKLSAHWSKLSAPTIKNIKNVLSTMLVDASLSRSFRQSLADVASIVARLTVPAGKWPELLPLLHKCTQHQSPVLRETGIYLFQVLMETIAGMLRKEFKLLHQIILSALKDSEPRVRVASLKAVNSFIDWLTTEEEVKMFRQFILPTIENIKYCLKNDLETDTRDAFGVFHTLAEERMDIVKDMIPDLVRFMLEVTTMCDELEVRKQALYFVEAVIQFKPKTFVSNNLLDPTLQVVFKMCCEEEYEDEVKEETAHKFAANMIDSIGLYIPNKFSWPGLIKTIPGLLNSDIANYRKAGITALAVTSEGCGEVMSRHLDTLLPHILKGMQDKDDFVRQAACIALGEFCKFLQPEILAYHEKLLPEILKTLTDKSDIVKMKCCYALQQLVENLDEDLPLTEIMTTLAMLIQQSSREVLEIVFPVMSAVALTSKANFGPFVAKTLELSLKLMANNEQDNSVLRGRATEFFGCVIAAAPEKEVQPFLQPALQLALQGLTELDYVDLREYTYSFFDRVASKLGKDFTPFLEKVVPYLICSCESSEGIVTKAGDEDLPDGIIEEDEEDEDDEELGEGLIHLNIFQSFMDEKSAAINAIGTICKSVGSAFMPYFAESLEILEQLTLFIDANIRSASICALADLTICMAKAVNKNNDVVWQKGRVVAIPDELKQVATLTITRAAERIKEDEDSDVVLSSIEAVMTATTYCGPAIIVPHLDAFMEAILTLLSHKTTCQTQAESFDMDVDVDVEYNLYNVGTECLIEVSKVVGKHMARYMPHLMPIFAKHLPLATDYQVLTIGAIAEVANTIEEEFSPFAIEALRLAISKMKDDDSLILRNSTYLVAVICRYATNKEVVKFYPQILEVLSPLFRENIEEAINDNACAAIGSMLFRAPSLLPLPSILPVLFSSLPLKCDFECGIFVYEGIFAALQTNNAEVIKFLPTITEILSKELVGRGDLSLKNQVVMALKILTPKYPKPIETIVKNLKINDAQKAQLAKLISS